MWQGPFCRRRSSLYLPSSVCRLRGEDMVFARMSLLFSVISLLPVQALAQQNNIPCTCRYQGEDFELGQEICLKSPSGEAIARCEMMLNNTSWKFTKTPCPIASADPNDDLDTTASIDHEQSLSGWRVSQSKVQPYR